MAVTQTQYQQLNKPYPHKSAPPKKDLGKDAFMKLFVAQLKHQDPLNPLSDKDTTAQMAQFSQLEQLTNMTKLLQGIAKGMKVDQTLKASGLIGKSILADGNSLSKSGSSVTGAILDIPSGSTSVKVNIHDSEGNIIRTVDLDNVKAGKTDFTWDGKNAHGSLAGDGVYKMSVIAENADGKKLFVRSQVEGVVQAVEVKNGEQVLALSGDREVLLSNVWKIVGQKTS